MARPMETSCGHKTVGPVYLYPKCHDAPTFTKLMPDRRTLVIECAQCEAEVARFELKVRAS